MNRTPPLAIWITGLPASGKSTVTREVCRRLHVLGIFPVVLESDALRTVLTPEATYTAEERDRFYHQLTKIGGIIAMHGVPVIFDATAHLKRYREAARPLFPHFMEVFIDTPLDICKQRDPKGIYADAAAGHALSVPGIQVPYERPDQPDIILDGRESSSANADRIIGYLQEFRYI